MDGPDHALATCFDALASPVRLRILRALRRPSSVTQIEVGGARAGAGEMLARQTVRRHLDKLMEAGIAVALHREGGEEYVTNHRRLFALSEELRDLARLRPLVEPQEATVAAGPPGGPPRPRHQLVLLKGLDEGTTYDLTPPGPQWTIGRRRSASIPLDYDPAVSTDNAIVRWDGGSHTIEDVPGSRNGTSHNFRRLGPGQRSPLRHGDVLGVGRSFLVYWRAP